MMIYRCVAMFILPDADFADDAEERRSFIVLKENKSAFFCVICARLRPVNTSKHTVKSSFNYKQLFIDKRPYCLFFFQQLLQKRILFFFKSKHPLVKRGLFFV